MKPEPPAVCYVCGNDIEDTPRFGIGNAAATCDACARSGRQPGDPGPVRVPRS